MEIELRIFDVEPDYRWNWLEYLAPHAAQRFVSYRDDATFVCTRTAGDAEAFEAVLAAGPSPVRKSTIRKLTGPGDFAMATASPVLEIRQYRLKPGTRARFAEFLQTRTAEPHVRHEMPLLGQFDDIDDENVHVFLRAFPSLVERDRRKAAFYQSALWLEELQDEAFAMIEDYSNVLLVMPVPRGAAG